MKQADLIACNQTTKTSTSYRPFDDVRLPSMPLEISPVVALPETRTVSSLGRKQVDLTGASALERLFNDVAPLPLLTLQDERELALRRIAADEQIASATKALSSSQALSDHDATKHLNTTLQQAQAIRDEVVCKFMEGNIRLAIKIANDHRHLPTPPESRVASAIEGIREAARRFVPDTGARFSTYAAVWIRNKIYLDCRHETRMIRLSQYTEQKLSQLTETEDKLSHSLKRQPLDSEIAAHMGIKGEQLSKLRLAQQTITISIDAPTSDQASTTVGDFIRDANTPIPGTLIVAPDQLQLLSKAMKTLTERERAVVHARFGFSEESAPPTLEAIGEQMELTRERIRQIQCNAMDKLREYFERNDQRTLMSVRV